MKKIGIVGGVGWRSTVDYYSGICRRCEPGPMPEISIESLDLGKAVAYLGVDGDEESWLPFDGYHRAALQRLETSGADFALMASNTPHHRFASIVRGIGIPVIDIFEAVARESARLGVSEILILGTSLTMKSLAFREEFARHGIDATGPHDEAIKAMTAALIADLQLGKREGAAERLSRIAKSSFGKAAVCLACTELPMAFKEQRMLASFVCDGVLFINTTAVHINAAVDLGSSHDLHNIGR